MRSGIWVILMTFATLTGCGPSLKTHPVQGRVVLTEGNVEDLQESHVEFALESDATVRGSGLISSGGLFRVEMIHKGEVLKGLPPGKYSARLILSDEGPAAKKGKAAVPRRYLDFKTAEISIAVPTAEDVVITLARK